MSDADDVEHAQAAIGRRVVVTGLAGSGTSTFALDELDVAAPPVPCPGA